MQERRKYIRISESVKVSYQLLRQCKKSHSLTKDFSEGGLCLPVFQRFVPGVVLKLVISLLEFPKPIEIIGEVVWLKEREAKYFREDKNFPFEAGIKFIKIDPDDLGKIRFHVQKRVEEKKARDIGLIEE